MMTKYDWEEQIGYVTEMLRNLNYGVIEQTDEQDRAEFSENVVYINSRCHPETRFYTLLHEYGHVEIYEFCAEEFAADVPRYQVTQDGRSMNSRAVRVSTVAEEVEAWRRGRWMARTEGLYIDNEKYNRHMTEALMSYINWASDE